jgi:hypothetical protein
MQSQTAITRGPVSLLLPLPLSETQYRRLELLNRFLQPRYPTSEKKAVRSRVALGTVTIGESRAIRVDSGVDSTADSAVIRLAPMSKAHLYCVNRFE